MRSIQWMLTLGGGLSVLGLIVWLTSWGVFKNKLVLAAALGIGSLAILAAGWWVSLKADRPARRRLPHPELAIDDFGADSSFGGLVSSKVGTWGKE